MDRNPGTTSTTDKICALILAVCMLWIGVLFGKAHPGKPKPLPVQRHELKDSANHVVYSYEAHSNRVLTQSPDLTLTTWREVKK